MCPGGRRRRRKKEQAALGRGHMPPSHRPPPTPPDSPEHGCRLPRVLLGRGGGARGQEGIGASLLPVKGLVLSDAPLLHAVLKHRHDQLQGRGWREDREVTLGSRCWDCSGREGPSRKGGPRGGIGRRRAHGFLSENMHTICRSACKLSLWFKPHWLDISPVYSSRLLCYFQHLSRSHSSSKPL